uniref:ORF13a n=1 Tax=Rhizobium rhizogenes TaxID=359 RepID=Q44196_RHIRH|nr:ORF13a [Rhizobium rhizogenes]
MAIENGLLIDCLRNADSQDGMLTVRTIPLTPLGIGILSAVCRRSIFFKRARWKNRFARCSATVPMAMPNESYGKKHRVRYKPPALSPLRRQSPARSSCSSPRRQSIWNT